MGSDGIGIWGNDGGDLLIFNNGVAINGAGTVPSYSLDVFGSIRADNYYSFAGNSGINGSVTVYDANLTTNVTLTFENGLLTSIV